MKNILFNTPEGSKGKDQVIFLLLTHFSHFGCFLTPGWVRSTTYQWMTSGSGRVSLHMKNLLFTTPDGSKGKDSVIFLLLTLFSHFGPFLTRGWVRGMTYQQSSLGSVRVCCHMKNLLSTTPEGSKAKNSVICLQLLLFFRSGPFWAPGWGRSMTYQQ